MGYTTDFESWFDLNKKLDDKLYDFLIKFNQTRRMKRKMNDIYGKEGEFYIEGKGDFGQDDEPNVIDDNKPPSTQPGLWCQWIPTENKKGIEWDGGEKFYEYVEWIIYIIDKILKPNGYILNGEVKWQGEEMDDRGKIIIKNNKVTTVELE